MPETDEPIETVIVKNFEASPKRVKAFINALEKVCVEHCGDNYNFDYETVV